jgi:peptidoglycan/LPS O-acetylase OafA/YrhL
MLNLNILKREISNKKIYIPYIDGLRFFAVFVVILDHFRVYYIDRIHNINPFVNSLLGNSGFGVFLFFAISGFLIGQPFAQHFINKDKKPSLKRFYLRRITRLEPPYILLLTLFFAFNLFEGTKGGFSELFPHYLASFFYMHNIIYGELPLLNGVLWSLEIEIQFYLIAPFIAYIFKINPSIRRIILLIIILFWSHIVNILGIATPMKTLVSYFRYFMVGFLVVDFYVSYQGKEVFKKNYLFDILCILSFILLWINYIQNTLYPMLTFVLLYFSVYTKFWIKILEIPLLTIIGSMCYSIYMLHQRVMYYFMNHFFFDKHLFFNNLYIDLLISLLMTVLFIILISIIFYIYVEKPTMKKDWYKFRHVFTNK